MSLLGHYQSVTKPKVDAGVGTYATQVRNAISSGARSTKVTGTWNESIQVFKRGDVTVIAPSKSVLKSNPVFKSKRADGDYTEFLLKGGQYNVKLKKGGYAHMRVNGNPKSPLMIALSVGTIGEFIR